MQQLWTQGTCFKCIGPFIILGRFALCSINTLSEKFLENFIADLNSGNSSLDWVIVSIPDKRLWLGSFG